VGEVGAVWTKHANSAAAGSTAPTKLLPFAVPEAKRAAVDRISAHSFFPKIPHQLCQIHYLRDAAKPIVEADRHAGTQLKAQVRGIRLIERALEGRTDESAEAGRSYCLAVRSSLTDDRHPPKEGEQASTISY